MLAKYGVEVRPLKLIFVDIKCEQLSFIMAELFYLLVDGYKGQVKFRYEL